MALVDLDKTSYKFKDIVWAIGLLSAFTAGLYRFESRMNELSGNQSSLEQKIMYKYELEFLKINNRMDLLEARGYAFRKDFKSDSISKVTSINLFARTNRKREENKRYPQVCMIVPRTTECQRKKLVNLKTLIV